MPREAALPGVPGRVGSMVADNRTNSLTSASCICTLLLQSIYISACICEESQNLEDCKLTTPNLEVCSVCGSILYFGELSMKSHS